MSDEQYRRLFGFTKKTMELMVEILREAYAAKHKRRGRHRKLAVEDMLLMACKYWREYVTYLSLGHEYGVAESTAHDIVVWVEDVLVKSGRFGLPGKKKLLTGEKLEVILVDVTESPVERPKHGQKRWYSGKKKRHTIKTQIVICAKTKIIIAIFIACGSTHDFKIWKKSIGAKVVSHIKIQADSGYQGISKLHSNHAKRLANTLTGKEISGGIKGNGKINDLLKAPFKLAKKSLESAKNSMASGLSLIDRIEKTAQRGRDEKAGSIKDQLEAFKPAAPRAASRGNKDLAHER